MSSSRAQPAIPGRGDRDEQLRATGGGGGDEQLLAGLASVAALTFVVARAVPLGWTVAVAAGIPLARAGERHGARRGYATAAASLVETTAIMGPARIGIPMPHAASGPLLGVLYRRRAGLLALALAGAAVRTVRRGLRRWDRAADGAAEHAGRRDAGGEGRGHPRAGAIVLAGVAGFAAALATTDPLALGALAAALAAAWAATAAGGRALLQGLALSAPLGLSTFGFGLAGGIGAELAARRAARVALLVLIAVWVRSAAGAEGLRRVLVGAVWRLRRVPLLATTAAVLAGSTRAGDLGGAARRLGARLRAARRRPVPIIDAALDWLATESERVGTARGSG